MPIYQGNTILPQVYLGNNKIYRVYRGNELEHGIFNAVYNVGPGSVSPTSQEFTWGIGLSSLPVANCSGATFNGWYTEKALNNKTTSIAKDVKIDTNLYAYFEKSKTQYSGQYQWQSYEKIKDAWDEQVWHEGGGSGQSFTPLSEGEHWEYANTYSQYPYEDKNSVVKNCAAWTKYRSNSLGGPSNPGGWANPDGQTPKAGAFARWGPPYYERNAAGEVTYSQNYSHVAFVEKVYSDGTPLFSHGGWSPYKYINVTTDSGGRSNFMGYYYTSLCTDGGGGGYWETVHHDAEYGYVTHYGTVGWQDSNTPPQGSWSSGNPQTRIVYSHYDYNSNNWTDWYTK